jgi:hypothetical protein
MYYVTNSQCGCFTSVLTGLSCKVESFCSFLSNKNNIDNLNYFIDCTHFEFSSHIDITSLKVLFVSQIIVQPCMLINFTM